jgi:hypothetical protein
LWRARLVQNTALNAVLGDWQVAYHPLSGNRSSVTTGVDNALTAWAASARCVWTIYGDGTAGLPQSGCLPSPAAGAGDLKPFTIVNPSRFRTISRSRDDSRRDEHPVPVGRSSASSST